VRHAAQLVGLVTAGLFTGGTLFGALVEHPARIRAGPRIALAVLGPSMRRATVVEMFGAALTLVACALATILGGSVLWLIAGVTIGCVVPIVFLLVLPINRRLARVSETDPVEIEHLLRRYGRLHETRAALGLTGFVFASVAALA
jgi:hypothetical protein